MRSREPMIECLDCGALKPASGAPSPSRCHGCLQRYEVQLFLLRKFLSRSANS